MSHKKIEEVTSDFWENDVNELNKELIEAFLEQQHLSPATLKQYESSLKIFAKWNYDNNYLKKEDKEKDIINLKPRDALKYQNFLISKGLSPNAIKFKRSCVSSLCGFIEVFYSDDYPLFRNIYTKAVPSVAKSNVKTKEPLTTKEINQIMKHLKDNEQWQKLAYFAYSYSTGCRREESRQLLKEVATYEKHKDRDGNEKPYYLTHNIRAKGRGVKGKVRKFTFDEIAMSAIQKWIEIRGEDDCPYLFVRKKKGIGVEAKQLSANTFNEWCKDFSKIIDGKKVHPHLLRSSRATNAVVGDGKDIKAVQKLLGHNSSETTEIYVVRDNSDDLDDLF